MHIDPFSDVPLGWIAWTLHCTLYFHAFLAICTYALETSKCLPAIASAFCRLLAESQQYCVWLVFLLFQHQAQQVEGHDLSLPSLFHLSRVISLPQCFISLAWQLVVHAYSCSDAFCSRKPLDFGFLHWILLFLAIIGGQWNILVSSWHVAFIWFISCFHVAKLSCLRPGLQCYTEVFLSCLSNAVFHSHLYQSCLGQVWAPDSWPPTSVCQRKNE